MQDLANRQDGTMQHMLKSKGWEQRIQSLLIVWTKDREQLYLDTTVQFEPSLVDHTMMQRKWTSSHGNHGMSI